MDKITRFSMEQKMEAISMKYYSGYKWTPKNGDYYTICRNDLELFKVVGVTDSEVLFKMVLPEVTDTGSMTKEEYFSDFHRNRVYVHPSVLNMESSDVSALEEKLEEAVELLTGCKFIMNTNDMSTDGVDIFLSSIKEQK